jgi:hypothetical protein
MVDSINVLPSALSELPKMFGLEELKKGENWIVVCSWSHTTWRRLFCLSVSWHPGCSSVRLVNDWVRLIGSLSYWTNVGNIPFQKCITIASACNLVFRTKLLRPDTIGIIPAQGYRQEEKHSKAIVMHFWKGSMPPCPSPDVTSKNSCLNVRQALLNMSPRRKTFHQSNAMDQIFINNRRSPHTTC